MEDQKQNYSHAFSTPSDPSYTFTVSSDFEWVSIASEVWRAYVFPEQTVVIDYPTELSVDEDGHRVLDAQGISHFIPYGWGQLKWETKEGHPKFVL